jgi:hypothetical protein
MKIHFFYLISLDTLFSYYQCTTVSQKDKDGMKGGMLAFTSENLYFIPKFQHISRQ